MRKNKYLLAVSGGADSMFLLDAYKNKNLIVCYVNYNQREDSKLDEQLVQDFCNKNKIPIFKLILNKNSYLSGNFQDWARKERYLFFKKIYEQEKCNQLLIAHHFDDFLETAIMQKNSGKYINYYGIKKTNHFLGMKIKRPLLFCFTKARILRICKKKNIPYRDDYTNFEDKYLRNRIRKQIKNYSFFKKIIIFIYFLKENLKLRQKEKQINLEYKIWKENEFSQDVFVNFLNQESLIYKFINQHFENVNLTKGKIKEIIKFLVSKNRTSKYKLDDFNYLIKKEEN
ncbi:tRNA(Ile)-lysidine synthase [Mycoplasmopsis gallopavonis]|uniref:tRNA(Ile)-lysidine synthase n=1 Tax=Mycoplasmopsis gallopavonis TaxID=76629 RepID=A0A449AZN0_9BACT|nr:tRNA lysidine(34) synthetase TilS [Mycoplasmopsis gallopavonis]VEU72973.1 tRNA(Ile)-lysidine synthase [Mycoplasmopsis gallopavonis]